jgi:hypothetical protein
MQTDKPRVRQSGLLSEDMHGERVIYDNGNKKVHHLNPTMTWIWDHCDGSRTIDELIAAVREGYRLRRCSRPDYQRVKTTGGGQPARSRIGGSNCPRGSTKYGQSACGGHCGNIDCRTDNDLDPCTHAGSGEIAPGKRWQQGQEGEEGQIRLAVILQSRNSRTRYSLNE